MYGFKCVETCNCDMFHRYVYVLVYLQIGGKTNCGLSRNDLNGNIGTFEIYAHLNNVNFKFVYLQ